VSLNPTKPWRLEILSFDKHGITITIFGLDRNTCVNSFADGHVRFLIKLDLSNVVLQVLMQELDTDFMKQFFKNASTQDSTSDAPVSIWQVT
jgi:hypothetical protein